MKAKEFIELFESSLNGEQVQLIKDTILYGYWGEADMDYANGTKMSDVFITDDAHLGGHFSGRKISGMFRAIYKELGILGNAGVDIMQIHDWWGDGSGNVISLHLDSGDEFDKLKEWSKN